MASKTPDLHRSPHSSAAAGRSVPIPGPRTAKRKKSGMMQSSLDLVFSYSRSQQMRYGKLNSAPSFVESGMVYDSASASESPYDRRRSRGRGGRYDAGEDGVEESGSGEEDLYEDEEDDYLAETPDGEGDEDMERRRSSLSPVIFHSDPVHSRQLSPREISPRENLEESVSTLRPNRPTGAGSQGAGDSGFRHLFSTSAAAAAGPSAAPGTSYGSARSVASSQRTTSPHDKDAGREDREATPKAREINLLAKQAADETTPLLSSKDASSTPDQRDGRRVSKGGDIGRRQSSTPRRKRRRSSYIIRGESTDGQTLFNAVAVLVGIGLLSMPLAFSYAGWIGGTFMLVAFAAITAYTAKLLARLILADPSLGGYTDIGMRAFGRWAGSTINILFCLELFALGVALIVLFGDSLEAIFPSIPSNDFKFWGFFIILPTALLPLRLLSLPSLLSTLSTFILIIIILIDGFSKQTPPGSILHPVETNWTPELEHHNWLGGIGLVLAGFGGHAVMPSLARDMRHPENFGKVVNTAFAIATVISFVAGAAGYLMIGNAVSDEITRDMLQEKYGYSRSLNLFALWMIVINPITKFGLASRPLNVTIEAIIGVAPRIPLPRRPSATPEASGFSGIISSYTRRMSQSGPYASANASAIKAPETPGQHQYHSVASPMPSGLAERRQSEIGGMSETRRFITRLVSRTIVTAACTAAAIFLPGFGKVMAFLGSFSAFLICIILPLLFYLRLAPRLRIYEDTSRGVRAVQILLVAVGVVLMVAGTVWAFLPGSGHGELKP